MKGPLWLNRIIRRSNRVLLFTVIILFTAVALASDASTPTRILGTPLPPGGGDPGKAYMQFLKEKNSSRQQFCKVTNGTLNGDTATLFVELRKGDLATGAYYESGGVRMIKTSNSWTVQTEFWGNASSAEANLSMGRIKAISGTLAFHKTHSGSYPKAKDMAALAAALAPEVKIRKQSQPEFEIPITDEWGHEFKYFVDSLNKFWIISFGADGKPDAGIYGSDGLPLNATSEHGFDKNLKTTDPNADIIYTGVDFVRYPAGKW